MALTMTWATLQLGKKRLDRNQKKSSCINNKDNHDAANNTTLGSTALGTTTKMETDNDTDYNNGNATLPTKVYNLRFGYITTLGNTTLGKKSETEYDFKYNNTTQLTTTSEDDNNKATQQVYKLRYNPSPAILKFFSLKPKKNMRMKKYSFIKEDKGIYDRFHDWDGESSWDGEAEANKEFEEKYRPLSDEDSETWSE